MTLRFIPQSELARIRTLDVPAPARAKAFADACRINALYMIARAGSGHVGTSFSCMDIVAWLFLEELRRDPDGEPADIFFSSKGHDAPGLYAVMTALGMLDFALLHELRRMGGLPGHPDVSTPGIHTNTGSLGMGISKAKGMAAANRLTGRRADIYVLTGDGELQEGQIWESLAGAVHAQLGELTVVVDHNKIQSDTWVRDVSDLGDLEAKFAAFGWYTARCDGHDTAALSSAFAMARTVGACPKLIIADTVKGHGATLMEPSSMAESGGLYRFHSGAPPRPVYEAAVDELVERVNEMLDALGAPPLTEEVVDAPPRAAFSSPDRLVDAYARALVTAARRDERIVVLDADLVLDCGLIPFRDAFPGRFFEYGIAEQDMVSAAGGMALRGLIPVVHSFACFLSTRPNEQIYNNATERTKIAYVASLAGVLPGGPGHSHQSVRDISALSAVPGLTMIEPCNEQETELAVAYCLDAATGSCYLRLVSIPVDVPFALPPGHSLRLGSGTTLRDGSDAVLVGAGPVLLAQAWLAAESLARDQGLHVAVVNLPWLNDVDAGWLAELAAEAPWVFTLDNHYVRGGQGQMIAASLAELDIEPRPRVRSLGVREIPHCGQNDEVLAAHRLDARSLASDIATTLRG